MLAAALAFGGCTSPTHRPQRQPPGMVSAADPRAAAAGVEILREGGSAADAAFATLLALNVVEPQSSGIGGGGYLVYSDRGAAPVTFDGRETAPHAATGDWFYARRPADGVQRRAARRQERRRAGQHADDGARAPALRQARLGGAVPAGDQARARRLQGHAAALQCAAQISGDGRAVGRGASDFLPGGRTAEAGRHDWSEIPRSRRSSTSSPGSGRTASMSGRMRRRSRRRSAAHRTIQRR